MRYLLQALLLLLSTGPLGAQVEVTNEGELFVAPGQDVFINGNFTNRSSQLANLGVVGLTGDFQNEARVLNPGDGLFRFIGDSEQNLVLFDTLSFFELEIFNPAGLNMIGDHHAEVHEHLYFEDGVINTTAESMIFFREFATYSDARDFSHINGPVLRRGDSDFVFPVGKGGVLRAPAVSELSAPTTFLAEYFDFSFSSLETDFTLNRINDQEYWQIERVGDDADARVTLPYDESSGFLDDLNELQIAYFNNDNLWTRREAQSDGASPITNLITLDFITNFGYFTTAEDRSFLADRIEIIATQEDDCAIIVSWVVPPDYPITLYEIERSFDGQNFEKIDEMPGDSLPFIEYTLRWYADNGLYAEPEIFYRLRINFPDGTSTLTNITMVENQCPFFDCTIFPNPVFASQNLKLRIESGAPRELPLQIYGVLGRLLWEETLQLLEGRRDYEIQTRDRDFPAGTYFLYLGPRKSLKFVVLR